jgi:hypothetical protein
MKLSKQVFREIILFLILILCILCVDYKLHQIASAEEKAAKIRPPQIKHRDSNATGEQRTRTKIPTSSLKGKPSNAFVSKYFDAVNFNVKDNYFTNLTRIVHPHDYEFTLQPEIEVCSASEKNPGGEQYILILSFVIIGVEFFEVRNLIRNTWANRSLYDEYDMQVFFVVGFARDERVNELVRAEARIHRDILQENYIDSYHFMTAKIIGALKWASRFCRNTRFLLRINDDVVVNTKLMIEFFRANVKRAAEDEGRVFENLIMGKLNRKDAVNREPGHKFYMSHEEYNETRIVPYINGEFYMLTSDLAARYVNLSEFVHWPPFSVWWEDLYMAMMSLHLGVDFVAFNEHYQDHDFNKEIASVEELARINHLEEIFFIIIYKRHAFQRVWDYLRLFSNITLLY